MAFYNPSKLVTDVLSKFLEFDPEQLQLGIWAGDLSIKNVQLKREAIYPLLNDISLPQNEGKPPLNLKLVSGSVGHMRIRIPWKRLVWGQGDVRLQISDVTLTVAYESRDETAARRRGKEERAILQEADDDGDEDEKKREARERKQEWLREAEKCQLQGLPIPDKPKVDPSAEEVATGEDASFGRSAGTVDRWLKNIGDNFAWRFFAGLQASIRNVRIAIVQDGMEIGAIFHSMDVNAEKNDSSEKEAQESDPISDEGTGGVTTATPPPNFIPKGEYEDGEHVNKMIKVQGFGVFIRREDNNTKIPPALKFSTSVAADDYLLRPTEGTLSFSFFYPHPVGKKRKTIQQITEEEPTTPTTATATAESVASSKSRRSKREKKAMTLAEDSNEAVANPPATERQPPDRRVGLGLTTEIHSTADLLPISDTSITGNRLKSHTMDLANMTEMNQQQRAPPSVPRRPSARAAMTPAHHRIQQSSIPLLRPDDASTLPPTTRERYSSAQKPRLDLSLSFGDVKTMFSSRHYELALLFNATVKRMQNGRPNKTIAECFGGHGPDTKRSVYVDAPFSMAADVERATASQLQNAIPPILTPSTDSKRSSVFVDASSSLDEDVRESTRASELPSDLLQSSVLPPRLGRAQTTGSVSFQIRHEKPERVQLYLQLQLPKVGSEHAGVVKSWWHYACSAVLFEVRQRRTEQATFAGKDLQFDWERQSYRRKEYVELYIVVHLEPSSVLRAVELKVLSTSRTAQERLLNIEDELSVEQIILYRAIARSLRVRGMRKMPDSVRDLHGDRWIESSPARHGSVLKRVSHKPGLSSSASLDLAEEAPNDFAAVQQKVKALRRRKSIKDKPRFEKNTKRKQAADDTGKSEVVTRTARSFHTAKSKFKDSSEAKERVSPSEALRVSFSVKFSNIEVSIYRDRQSYVGSVDSMRLPRRRPNGQLDSKIRSSGFQLVAGDASVSDFSDLSVLSDDQIFLGEDADSSNLPEVESLGNDLIMSSTDFLFGLTGGDVLLRAVVSGLIIKTRGHSGGTKLSSLTIERVSVSSHDSCHLISLLPRGERPPDEVIIDKPRKPVKSTPSFGEMKIFQEQAIIVSLVWKRSGAQLQCDLSKVKATIDVEVASNLVDFFADICVMAPQPVIAPTPVDELRSYVLRRLAIGKGRWIDSSDSVSCALRIHGVELRIPCSDDNDSFPRKSSCASESVISRDAKAQVKISMNLVEYYDGTFVEDICALASDFSEDNTSRITEGMSVMGNVDWVRRHLNMLDVPELITAQLPTSSKHSVIALAEFTCHAEKGAASERGGSYDLFDKPVDVELLLTRNEVYDFPSCHPSKQITVEVSPTRVVISEARLDVLARAFSSISTSERDFAPKKTGSLQPRLEALSSQVLVAFDLRISDFCLTCVEDSSCLQPSMLSKEIIMEESLSDFLSLFSCFHPELQANEALDIAKKICMDRLVVLGLSKETADDCVRAARLNFVAGIEKLKHTHSQVLMELAESSQYQSGSRKSSSKDCRDGGITGCADYDTVQSVKEMPDDDSEKSIDIIETTLKNAVERTMSSFGSWLENGVPEPRAFSDFLVISVPDGARVSMTKMFYDLRIEGCSRSSSVRNASGSHLLAITPPRSSTDDKDLSFTSTAPGFPSEYCSDGSDAISFSFFELDSEYDFGEGGLPLAILASHEEAQEPRQREQLNSFGFGEVDLFFAQEIVDQAIQSVTRLLSVCQYQPDISDKGADYAEKPAEVQSTLYTVISSITLILASDELVPFCRLKGENCTIDNVFESDASANRPCVNFEAQTCHMLDLTPEGTGYPDILFPLLSDSEPAIDPPASFQVQLLPSRDKWIEPFNLLVELRGVRFFLVRRFVNELLQYCVSEDYGLGLLLSKYSSQPQYDVIGNPPPPAQYHITIADSSIILPRCSTSTDAVAIEVDKVIIFNGFAVSSFTVPSASSKLNVVENVVYKGNLAARSPNTGRSSLSTSAVEFFDCVDQADAFGSEGPSRVSSFKKEWIKRTTVLLEYMRIFTSLPSGAALLRNSDCAVVHSFYRMGRRASENEPVYTRHRTSAADHCDEPARRWHEISASECSLEIVADYAPHLRLLITDRVIRRGNRSDTLPINLDMRMSELCLLLSIWYSNMQELPVMFPYFPLAVSSAARSAQPSVEVPEYGTAPYVERLKCPSKMKTEVAVICDALTIRGSFDDPGYFAEDPQILRRYASRNATGDERPSCDSLAFSITYEDCVLHYTTDMDGILRLALGASRCNFVDERRGKAFESVLVAGERKGDSDMRSAWADQTWGLDCNGCTFSGFLPQSHQVSVFMTPGWCLINFGVERADIILADLSPISVVLDYFASYFKSGSYGHPAFEATEQKEGLKRDLGRGPVYDEGNQKQVSLNVDFRLWLLHPCICIPQSVEISAAPSLSIECSTGFWYHYRSIGAYSLQEMGSTDLSLDFSNDFLSPKLCRNVTMEKNVRVLIDGLTFGLRMDFNAESQHSDYFFRMPLFEPHIHDASMMCSVISPELESKRIVLSPPSVCTPFVRPSRALGSSVCEFTMLLEVLPVVSSLLMNLITGPSDLPEMTDDGIEVSGRAKEEKTTMTDEPSFALVAHVNSLRIFAIDPVLELHLPVALACLSPFDVNVSHLRANRGAETAITSGDEFRDDFQVSIKSLIWADYFKLGVTRSWEPLLEPFNSLVLYERSKRRGHGLSFHSYDEFHVNITDALLTTFDESINSFLRSISETYGASDDSITLCEEKQRAATDDETTGATVADQLHTPTGSAVHVYHQIPTPFPVGSRIAFSFRNLTGQQIRIHQLMGAASSDTPRSMVTYLDHLQSTILLFDATISVANNLSIIEVPFPGLPNSRRALRGSSVNHEVDVQLPGFRWLEGITVNTSGRKFDSLVPRSSTVLSKVQRDWRLTNAMKILTEVGLENGGRLIAARSIFEVRNNTSHHINLSLHPSPTGHPSAKVTEDDRAECIEPGAVFHIPSLLLESSLRVEGNHLGSFWIRPDESKDDKDLSYLDEHGEGNVVGFCSRPVQLAKIVHETALIFRGNNGDDLEPKKARSGLQISCPVSVSTEGDYLAPFCYVIEIRRSPVVKSQEHPEFQETKATDKLLLPRRGGHSTFVHGPVSYSLRICPPLIIENLLPKRGRFELMHATSRTVVWFADLKPGERIPIHTVGLDAPLLLMLNLGFCRTPIGDGALVHHGSDKRLAKGMHTMTYGSGLKSIGKAVTKGTKQVGKTLTNIAESPDKRGQGKFFLIQNPQFSSLHSSGKRTKGRSNVHVPVEGGALGLDTGVSAGDGKVYGIEHEAFAPSDVDSETVVVDSVGQRLRLGIENVRGGGGQRRISVYCPYWIINTTEYALMYKQEKGSSFVSGTVISPAKDGSQPVDDSDRKVGISIRGEQKPVTSQGCVDRQGGFAGTAGALATTPGQGPLSPDAIISLLDKDLSLDKLTKVAFMFNFQDEMLSMGKRELCVQLSDGSGRSPYSSAWSQGFSLDSVGVNQVVSMHCKDGRALEISVTLGVAPSFLSGYTKLVRFAPRFVLVNHLERPIRLWQDSSLLHPLYEDRPAPGSELKGSKWHFKPEHDLSDVVNQYDNLFGRSAVLLDDGVVGMTGGTTAHKAALYIATVGKSDILPFHLPDTRSDRQLRIDLGGSWNLTSSFSADATGEYTFTITRAIDLRMLSHVTTRASPLYKVVLPPEHRDDSDPWDGELGLWFETDWGGDRRIIVKETKRGSYSFNHTDIHAGDELLRIDDFIVSQMTFSEAMKILKDRIADVSVERKGDKYRRSKLMNPLRRSILPGAVADAGIPLSSISLRSNVTLTFRTLEERLRRVRVKALQARRMKAAKQHETLQSDEITRLGDVESGERSSRSPMAAEGDHAQQSFTTVKVETRMLHHSVFIVVRSPDPKNPPFRIENRALEHVVYFRQRGCNSHTWNQVKPGESMPYSWEEPMRARKLTVRVGQSAVRLTKRAGDADIKCDTSVHGNVEDARQLDGEMGVAEKKNLRAERLKQLLSTRYVNDEEQGGLGASRSIKLEVIGFKDTLPCPEDTNSAGAESVTKKYLNCQVDTDGLTRVLIIADKANDDDKTEMQHHVFVLERQIREEEERKARILQLRNLFSGGEPMSVCSGDAFPVEDNEEMKLEVPTHAQDEMGTGTQHSLGSAIVTHSPTDSMARTLVEDELKDLADFPENTSINSCHQVLIEIIEAAGLRSNDANGVCNPYCEIVEKREAKSGKSFRSRPMWVRKTYFIENTTSPKWTGQVFIYPVPAEAAHITRGHAAKVSVRNFHWIGNHPSLGHTTVHLSSLRNQQEIVGWYPLVRRAVQGDLDDSLTNYGRGSIKIRMQWIHSVPGLIDYFLMLSERRSINLRQSVDGMKKQLIHAMEPEGEKKRQNGSLVTFRNPRARGRRKTIINSRTLRMTSGEDYDVVASRTAKPLRQSHSSSVDVSLRYSRKKHLRQHHFQTEESRRRSEDGSMVILEADESLMNESAMEPTEIQPKLNDGVSPDDVMTAQKDSSFGPLYHDGDKPGNVEAVGDVYAHFGGSSNKDDALTSRRARAFTEPDSRSPSERRIIFRDDSRLLNRDVVNVSRFARDSEFEDNDVLTTGLSFGDLSDAEKQAHPSDTLDALLEHGFIHHKGDTYLHRDHLSYHLQNLFVVPSVGNKHGALQSFSAKSTLRLSPLVRKFKSWTAAQAIFNDDELETELVDNQFHVALKMVSEPTKTEAEEKLQLENDNNLQYTAIAEQLLLPQFLPSAMLVRAKILADSLENSRRQFERACKRSLSALLNTGGWLTIRPMTALHLPDTWAGMFVRLRYGTETLSSKTVDANVSPTWTLDTTVQVTPYAHTLSLFNPRTNDFEYVESDLQVYVDPMTSGSMRLSVFGERLNKSKVELGVLHIPLEDAISCCLECIEDVSEDRDDLHPALRSTAVPVYVRWFPLMNPKETVAVDGDMGLSSRPSESEKLRENMFGQYFTPCIKLAFIWQPDEAGGGGVVSDQLLASAQNSKVLAGSLPDSPASRVTELYFHADVGRVSAALIDSQRAMELVSITIMDIDVRHSVTKSKTTTGLVMRWLQIDYQGDKASESVVLAPTPGEYAQPTLQFRAVKDNLRTKSNIESYEYAWIALQEMDLTLEESWMVDLWEFYVNIIRRKTIRSKTTFLDDVVSSYVQRDAEWSIRPRVAPRGSLMLEHNVTPTLSLLLKVDQSADAENTKKVYIEQLLLGYIKVNLSYRKGKKAGWDVNDSAGFVLKDKGGAVQSMTNITTNIRISPGGKIPGRESADSASLMFERWSEQTQDEDILTEAEDKYSHYPHVIASVFPSVSDAPIRLQGKVIEHVFESPNEIINSIKNYYQTEILKQIYKIIGALDFVGNPSQLLQSFVTGVRDFFVTPSEALLRSPKNPSRVGMGVAKGTLSLFSNSASGIFGFFSKISALAGQVAAALSLDEDFQRWHRDVVVAEAKGLSRQWKRRGVQSLPKMVARPVYDIVNGFVLGLTGTVYRPYIGAKRNGGKGFVKGMASGAAGLIAKPVAGVCDCCSHFSGSIYDLAKSVNLLEKRYEPPRKLRLPHVFGPKSVLMPYDQVAAQSEFLLKAYPIKVKQRGSGTSATITNEIHVASEILPMEPGVQTYAVVSSHRIAVFQVKRENGGVLATTLCWEVDLTRASSVSSRLQDEGHNGVALIIKTLVPKKKVKIVNFKPAQFSPERNVPLPGIKGTPLPSALLGLSQSSFYETPASVRSLGDQGGEDLVMSEGLGSKTSELWEETDDVRALMNEHDYVREFKTENNFRGSLQGRDGEILEWFSILAEFQQRGHLTRIHNAICCVIGDFQNIIDERSTNRKGSTEGYTAFGELYFGKDRAREAVCETPRVDQAVRGALDDLLWMHESQFQKLKLEPPEKQQELMEDMKNSWVLSREVSATQECGLPMWIVEACAKATFVPHEPPPLPDGLEEGDEVVSEIYTQLREGNISYEQARHLIVSHSKSLMVTFKLDNSGLSTFSDEQDLALDRLFREDADDDDFVGMDQFFSVKSDHANRPSSELAYLDASDQSIQSQAASVPVDFYASRSSLPYRDALESRELQSLAERSIGFEDVLVEKDKDNVSTSSSKVADEEARGEQLLDRQLSVPLSLRTKDTQPSGLKLTVPTQETRNRSATVQHEMLGWTTQDNTPTNSKLDRLEAMLEQLLIISARQAAQQNVQFHPPGRKEDPEMMLLRQEIEELRVQVQSKVTNNDREEMIVALRKEVSSLKQQLNEKDLKLDANEADRSEDQAEESSSTSTISIGRNSPEQLLKLRLALKLKEQLSAIRKKEVAQNTDMAPSPSTLSVIEEAEGDDQREVASV